MSFEIAFRVVIFLNDKILITWAAERVPPRAAKPAGNHPDHPVQAMTVMASRATLYNVVYVYTY